MAWTITDPLESPQGTIPTLLAATLRAVAEHASDTAAASDIALSALSVLIHGSQLRSGLWALGAHTASRFPVADGASRLDASDDWIRCASLPVRHPLSLGQAGSYQSIVMYVGRHLAGTVDQVAVAERQLLPMARWLLAAAVKMAAGAPLGDPVGTRIAKSPLPPWPQAAARMVRVLR